MKRLGLFFLFSVMTVFGAIVSMEQAISPKAEEKEAEMQRCVTLTLHTPPKPAPKPENKAEPQPKPAPKKQAEPKPKPVATAMAEPKPAPVPEPETAPKPKPEPIAEEALPQAAAVQSTPQPEQKPEPSPQQASLAVKALEEYYSRLYRRISENRRYPEQARRFGIEGEVGVAFEIDDSGRIVDSRLLRPSGNPLLDRESMRIFERIDRFEAPPLGLPQRRFEVTIAYSLRQR